MGRELDNIDLTTPQRKEITALLKHHLPDTEVWAYGSRVQFTAKPSSDLDIVAFTTKEQNRAVNDLKEAFEASALPFRVDLFVWDKIPKQFRKNIEKERVMLQKKKKPRGLPEGWVEKTLGDVIIINDDNHSKKDKWKFINYLDTGSLIENQISEIQHLAVGEDTIPSRAKRKIQPGDIIYSTVRPNQKHYGILKNPPENLLVSTGFSTIRAKSKESDTNFIYWFLAQPETVEKLQIIGEHSTSAYPSIKPSDIEGLKLNLPPLPEQKAIAHILGSLDDKIELNRRMSKTLEAIAQAIFKSWFIDFDPVKAKITAKAKLNKKNTKHPSPHEERTENKATHPSPPGRGAGGEGDKGSKGRKTPTTLLNNARKLRQSATDAEKLMWQLLRGRQINNAKFRRQHPIGQYVLDFYCHDLKLAIELDGSQHNETEQKRYDDKRTDCLEQQGIRILRFWNNQVLQETEAVLEAVYQATVDLSLTPGPSPQGRGDEEHPSVTLAAMRAISGKDEATLKQLQADQPETYEELKQIAALFPSELEYTEEMEWIPKGWKVSTVGNEFDVTMGQSPPGSTYNAIGEGIPFFQGCADFGFRYPSERVYCTAPKRFAEKNDTLVSVRAPVGNVNMAFDECCIGRGVGAIRHKSSSHSYTYYSMLHLRERFNTFEAEGTVFGSIHQKDFKALKWLSSDRVLIEKYERLAGQFDKKIEACYKNILKLTISRDTLLPELLSGEIQISETKKLVKNTNRNGDQND